VNIENQHIEWKENWKDDFLRNIVAFANSDGGVLYIGINDKGITIGILNAKKLLQILPQLINQKTGILPYIELIKKENKEIIKITVHPSSAPISYRGRYYQRSGSIVTELNGNELTHFLLKKSGITWDSLELKPHSDFKADSNTLMLFKELSSDRLPFAKTEGNPITLLRKLNLYHSSGLPTRAAILLFTSNPQYYFPQAVIKIGKFTSETNLISSDIVSGNLFDQINNTLGILQTKYLVSPIHYEGIHRREILEYPLDALREAILNAIIHRDYGTTSAIQIRIYNNKLIIMNEGRFPPEVPIRNLNKAHLSIPRNVLLADLFYKSGFIESWGRGTLKIIEACKNEGLPEPVFKEENNVVSVCFNKLTTEKVTEKVTERVTEKVTENQQLIYKLVKKNPKITIHELSLEVNIAEKNIKNNLAKLKKLGYIIRKGSPRAGYWETLIKGNNH